MSVATYTKSGAKATTPAKLDKTVFATEVKNHELIRQSYESYLSNGRTNSAVTKTRGLVRGGGKKPWKQKGTGRARFGSIRTPIWRGGGITFGPTGNETYTVSINKKAKKKAIKQALTIKNNAGAISIIESFTPSGKVSDTVKLLNKLGATRGVVIAVAEITTDITRSTKNIPYVKVVRADRLNVFDVVNSHTLLITKDSLDIVTKWLGGEK